MKKQMKVIMIMYMCFIALIFSVKVKAAGNSEAYLKTMYLNSNVSQVYIKNGATVSEDKLDGVSYEGFLLDDYINRNYYTVYSDQSAYTVNLIPYEVSEGAVVTARYIEWKKSDGTITEKTTGELNNSNQLSVRIQGSSLVPWVEMIVTSEDGTASNSYFFMLVRVKQNNYVFLRKELLPDPQSITIEDAPLITALKNAYDELDNEEKQSIAEADIDTTYNLQYGIDRLNEDATIISDIKNAEEVSKKIAELKGDGTDKEAVIAARIAYETLSSKAKALISEDLKKLEAAEKAVEDKVSAEEFEKNIEALKGDGTDSDEAIAAAKAAYEALSPEAKELAKDAFSKLEAAEKAVEEKKAADEAAKKAANVKTGETFKVGKNNFKVTKISGKAGEVAFVNCTSKKLTKVTIPATVNYKGSTFKVTSIQKNALKGYKKLKTVTIGKNITNIGANAFSGDAKLKKIIVKSIGLKKVGAKALKGIHKKAVIKVPKKMLKKYKKLFKGKGQKKTVKVK